MVNEVNTRTKSAVAAGLAPDPRRYLRDEELDRGVGLILAGERALLTSAARQMMDSDLSVGEWQVLLAIHYAPGQDVSAVRSQLGATVPTFARLLGKLDRRGLIGKARMGVDGRRRALSLSEAGEAVAAPVAEGLRETLRRAYREAGPEAVSGTRLVLEALTQDPARHG